MHYPLFVYDKKPIVPLRESCKKSVAIVQNKIDRHEFNLIPNSCYCNNVHEERDVIVSEKDKFGLPIPQVLCSKCGLLRSGKIFDVKSNEEFYQKYYRSIYNSGMDPELYFSIQRKRGLRYINLIKKLGIFDEIEYVAELGCGAGGIMYTFQQNKKNIIGVDLDSNYIKIGKSHGLNIICGDIDEIIDNNSCDLVVLSHVFEHLINPLSEIRNLLKKVKKGKYLLLEVPGIYMTDTKDFDNKDYNLLEELQNAHVVQFFYKEWFDILFGSLNMNILYGDEQCTFVCQKICDEIPIIENVYDDRLSNYPSINLDYIIHAYKKYLIKSRKYRFKSFIKTFLLISFWRKILNGNKI
jgi:SAM-dependent methyltransferase